MNVLSESLEVLPLDEVDSYEDDLAVQYLSLVSLHSQVLHLLEGLLLGPETPARLERDEGVPDTLLSLEEGPQEVEVGGLSAECPLVLLVDNARQSGVVHL